MRVRQTLIGGVALTAIAPLPPYRLKGFVGVQGASNAAEGRDHGDQLRVLIEFQRDTWRQGGDWDPALDELAERGCVAVRIDAHPHRQAWGRVKKLCLPGVEQACTTGRWEAFATSNSCGLRFVGMWRDIAWRRHHPKRFKTFTNPHMENRST